MVRALLTLALSALLLVRVLPASAQDQGLGGSFITPFPDNDVYQVQVVGDWLAEGLLSGLVEAFTTGPGVSITRKRYDLAGLMRNTSSSRACPARADVQHRSEPHRHRHARRAGSLQPQSPAVFRRRERRMARRVRRARRPADETSEEEQSRRLLGRSAEHAALAGQRACAAHERRHPRARLHEWGALHRCLRKLHRRERRLQRLGTGHYRQGAPPARQRRRALHAGRISEAGAFRRARTQARHRPSAHRALHPTCRRSRRAVTRQSREGSPQGGERARAGAGEIGQGWRRRCRFGRQRGRRPTAHAIKSSRRARSTSRWREPKAPSRS